MFTGLIQDVGKIIERSQNKIKILSPTLAPKLKVGGSISVNGVCLTVETIEAPWFECHLSEETFRRTTLPNIQKGSPVNLELPLRFNSFVGGHFVQGHVDGQGTIVSVTPVSVTPREENLEMKVAYPLPLSLFMVEKGSIAVDGISLTINSLEPSYHFTIMLIPHTLSHTIARTYRVGQKVNLEVDILSKYVQNFLQHTQKEAVVI